MKILVVHGRQINAFPPVRNLIKTLVKLGHEVTVVTRDTNGAFFPEMDKIKYIVIPDGNGILSYFQKKQKMRSLVKKLMTKNDILWTTTDTTVRDLGDIVLKYNHIMQLLELIEDIPAYPFINFIGLNIKKYAREASAVVVPEINRAYIQKTWWNLKTTPFVLPNKMERESVKEVPTEVKAIIDEVKVEKRKIILYQGVFTEDRHLDNFAEAIDSMDEEYCLYLMGHNDAYCQELCEKYNNIKYIPFIRPPFHLLVTQYAHIGLLPYVAKKASHYSALNALYCAPNKIYEYAASGLPMIGSDVLGLRYPFEKYGIGKICATQKTEEIKEIIKQINFNYDEMRNNCISFYDSVDMVSIVNNILQESLRRES